MGGWVLEVVKMTMYVSFPVCLFHYFNSPGNIDANLLETRQKYIDNFIGNSEFEARRREIELRKREQLEARDSEH